ncbi:MAG TPA: aldo/keto reductase [Tepidisphaeraceae bacterium]|nr:aldo/keto reductase [Tepidisphaeraceae bacterium]
MEMNRRQFLTTTLAGAGVALMNHPLLAAAESPVSNDPFQMVPLGKTGLKVSLIGAGTGMRGGGRQSNMTRLGKEKFEALLKYEFEKGIRLFDCADMYGTHPYVASAFKGLPREQYAISTKIWVMDGALPEKERPDANIVVDRFRKELNTDYIDLVLVHCMMAGNWCEQWKRQMDIMEELKSKGIIKAHGASIHSLQALKAAAESPWVDSVHVRINAFGDSMDGKPEVVAPVLKQLHDAGKGVIGMKLVGEGRYRNDPAKRDESIRYVLGLETVNSMVVGFETPAEVDDFAMRVKNALAAKSKPA